MPQQSVVIVLKNGVPDTLRTVQSLVMTATEMSFELVLVDNGTTDETANVINSFDGEVKVVRLERARSVTSAVNRGVEVSAGDLVTVLPQGATLAPGWQRGFVEALGLRDRVQIVGPALCSSGAGGRVALRAEYDTNNDVSSLRFEWVSETRDAELFAAAAQVDVLAMAGLTFIRNLWGEFGRFDEALQPDLAAADFCLRNYVDKSVYSYFQPGVTFGELLLESEDNLSMSQWPGAVPAEKTWARLKSRVGGDSLQRLQELDPPLASAMEVMIDSMASGTAIGRLPYDAVEYLHQLVMMEEERRLLEVVRAGRDVCWTDEHEKEPLVSLVIATHKRLAELMERAIPSALNQTYERIEVRVVGDKVDENMEKHLSSIKDPRFRFINLGARGVYPI